MLKTTTFLPSYDGPDEQHQFLLKQSLIVMNSHKIPMHPLNYAIFYDYCAGHNQGLIVEVDKLLTNRQLFNYEASLRLYQTYICHATLKGFEAVYAQLFQVITSASSSAGKTNEKASEANDRFTEKSKKLAQLEIPQTFGRLILDIQIETQQLAEASQQLKNELRHAQCEMERLRKEMSHIRIIAKTDALTGLLNRGAFEEELALMLTGDRSQQACLALLDLDHFKRINDDFGHLVGDKVLKFFGGLIKKHAFKHHKVARYGGEEIAILMSETSVDQALMLCEKIRKLLETSQLKRTGKDEPIGKVTVSIGISALKIEDTAENLIDRTDQALYQAKRQGRNQIVIYKY